ncbi:MAG: DUF3857 domain-containing protein [Bacteroidales bacterium]
MGVTLLFTPLFSLQGALPENITPNPGERKYANSIVRIDQTDFDVQSRTNATQKRSTITTILNKEGKEEAAFICYCDKFRELKQFSGELYNAQGVLIRKFKKSDLIHTEYFEGLASDNYTYYLDAPDIQSYPYTIKYEWELKHKDGLISYPVFVPQTSYNQAVDTAVYQITLPAQENLRFRSLNSNIEPVESTEKNRKSYLFTYGNLNAIEHEPMGLSLTAMIPHVYFTPEEFSFEGTTGNISDWNNFGKWQAELLNNRDILSEEAKRKVKELTAGCGSDREKVNALYDFLGKTTRYVSIQLGIGGLQPTPAQDVFKTGFSDCKGLSNYLKALLSEAGIPSVYTVISTTRSHLLPDFASANQMNHVILQVPLPGDTLWLECTNPEEPFGYIHNQIAGHDALLIHPDGGEIYRLPQKKDSLHKECYYADIYLGADGNAKGVVSRKSWNSQYENRCHLIKLEDAKQRDRVRGEIKLPSVRIQELTMKENKCADPSFEVRYEAELGYGTQTGNRLFIPANIFRNTLSEFSSRKPRTQPIALSAGFTDSDTIHIHLPEGYNIESTPAPQCINNDFGSFSAIILPGERKISVIQTLSLKKGIYPVEKYEDFRKFTEVVSRSYSGKIVLKKDL